MKIKINNLMFATALIAASFALAVAVPVLAATPRNYHQYRHNTQQSSRSTETGTVTSVNGSSFTMNATSGSSYSVDGSNASARMHDGSKLIVSDIEINDSVTVVGTIGTIGGNTITAQRITDNSLRRFVSVRGTISSVSGTSFVMQTTARGAVTVNIAGNGGVNGSTAYPVVGEYARATGTWDQANKVLWTTDVRVSESTSNGYNYNNTNNNTANGTGSVSLSLSPYSTTLTNGETTTVTANGYDATGIASMGIYVNGSLVQSCPVSNYPTSYSCTVTLYGSTYTNYSTIAVYGQLSDRNGYTAISPTTTLEAQNGTGVNGTGSGTVSLSVSSSTLLSGQTTTVNASAYDASGMRSIGIYANGSLVYTCPFSAFTASANCATTLNGNSYATGSTVSVYAQMTDLNGYVATSSTSTLTVNNTTNGTTSSGSLSVSLSLSPYSTTIANGEITTITATGYDPNGVTNTSIYVNGSLAMACPVTNSPTTNYCTATLNGSNYANGSLISIYAQATDIYGNVSTSSTTTLTATNTAYGVTNEYVTLSLYPYTSSLGTSQTTTLTAAASDMNGVSSIGIYVNGSLVQTCPFGSGNTNASCTYNIAGSNYPVGSTVSIYAQATDVSGVTVTSSTSTLTIQTASVNGSMSTASTPYYGEYGNGHHRWNGWEWR